MNTLQRKFDESQTIENFRKVTWFYNAWSWFTESKAAKKVLELAGIQDGMSVLEVAVGTGVVFEKITLQNPGGRNVGTDLSPDMLNKARKRLKIINPECFELMEVNVLEMNLPAESFDIIINNFMVDLMPEENFDQIAQEFHRVLKPGGLVIMSTFSFGTKKIHRFWLNIAKRFPDLLTGCRPVSFKEHLINAGFSIGTVIGISQNTFPSEIIKARKTENRNR